MRCNINFRRLLCFFIIGVLCTSTIVLVIPEKASASFVYSVDVQALNDTVYVDVGPGQPAYAALSFRVTNDGHNLYETIVITVTYGPGATSVTISPAQFTLQMEKSKIITAYVSVDRNTVAPTQVPITACAEVREAPWYEGDCASATMIVKQFSFIVIDPGEGVNYTLDTGSSKTIDFKITNQGNGNDIILFEGANRDELIKKGWEIPESEELTIPTKTFKSLSFKIKAPSIVLVDEEVNITLKATSQLKDAKPSQYTQYTNITVKVNSNAPVVIGAPTILIILLIALFISRKKGWPPKLWTKKSN